MDTLIVALFAGAIVLIEAGYWLAISLARWSPVIAAGAIVGWLSADHGASALEAACIGVVTCFVARFITRHFLRTRWHLADEDYRGWLWRERWMTRKERERMQAGIEAAGSVGAWIRAGRSPEALAKQRETMGKMNALARSLATPSPILNWNTITSALDAAASGIAARRVETAQAGSTRHAQDISTRSGAERRARGPAAREQRAATPTSPLCGNYAGVDADRGPNRILH